jgi:hypothetical protein
VTETVEPQSWYRKAWGWFTLTNAAPEVDPVRTVSMGAVAVSTAILSYDTLRHLGSDIGLTETASYLFPFAFDFAVLAATRAWLHPRLGRGTRTYAATVAIFCMIATVVGNGIEHWKVGVAANSPVWWTVTVIAFASMAPLVLGLMVHLAAMIRADMRSRADRDSAIAAKVAARVAKPQGQRAEVPAELEATGTEGGGTVTDLGDSPTAKIRRVYDQMIADDPAVRFGRGPGLVSLAAVDREAGTNGYAKKLVPNWEVERLSGENDG